MYELVVQILFVTFFAYYFYTREKPKTKFLILGFLFSLLSLLLQIPLRIFELEIEKYFLSDTVPLLLIAFGAPIISETVKYFSLKRYMKTKSHKNGIFFGIGWVIVESIPYISMVLYSTVFSYISLSYAPQSLVDSSIPLLDFIFFFIINLSITALVVFAVIKNKFYYVLYAIVYSAIIYLMLQETTQKLLFQGIFLLVSLFIILRYRLFK